MVNLEEFSNGLDIASKTGYTGSGISITWEDKIMNTAVSVFPDGTHLMNLCTYINREELESLRRNHYEVLLGKDFYDDLSEATRQAKLNNSNELNISYIIVSVNMTGTIFDKLCSLDTDIIEKFYNANKLNIDNAYKNKPKWIKDLDTFTIAQYAINVENKVCIIRDIQTVKSTKHDLKCVSQRKIIKYKLINLNAVNKVVPAQL